MKRTGRKQLLAISMKQYNLRYNYDQENCRRHFVVLLVYYYLVKNRILFYTEKQVLWFYLTDLQRFRSRNMCHFTFGFFHSENSTGTISLVQYSEV